ncbi:MAG: transposase [Planctomycetes bacterium]|nr:transposase [Planctomycetota bacterium]
MVLGNDTWNLEPPPSVQGLREDLPIKVYQRNLPHWRQSVATYFVTFRLADSIPQECLELLQKLRAEWATKNPPPHSREALDQLARILHERTEYWLDQGMGSCILKDERISRLVDDSLKHFHQTRYELGASVIMSNHVHCIVRPLPTVDIELEDILGNLKAFSAKQINGILDQSGVIWQQESYDRIIRDPEHLWRCLQYIGKNPAKARRSGESCRLWVYPQWEALGWGFAK